jgi:transcriptional regulator with XRE-family HTH domain
MSETAIYQINRQNGTGLASLFIQIRIEIMYCCIEDLAERAGVHISTLYSWRDGKVQMPLADNLINVATALGYIVTWNQKQ